VERDVPLLARFLGKLVLDVLPAALASLIGGFLVTQYQFGHPAAPQPLSAQATPASAEMIQLVRDEHTMILDFLNSQAAAEKNKLAAEDQATARAAVEAKMAEAATARAAVEAKMAEAAAVHHASLVAVASKARRPYSRAQGLAAAAVPHAPLVVARVEQSETVVPAATAARDPNSLIAKTLDLKDNVVAATRRVVGAIGDIPTWIVDRIASANAAAAPADRRFSTAS
jgi:hypothetical protein